MSASTLFVTGMLRSGTTLLEKLLAGHASISLLSQPFPLLFVEAKRAFLGSIGEADAPYPLSDLFLERRFSTADFAAFLREYRAEPDRVREVFQSMRHYSGQGTRFDEDEIDAAVAAMPPVGFLPLVEHLYRVLARRPDARVLGAKETLCEEFLPSVLDAGGCGVVIVRDPRDMLVSLNHGRGGAFAGAVKPTLFNLRHWRKSVAFALHLQDAPRFLWTRYEDLVMAPLDVLTHVTRVMGVAPFDDDVGRGGIRDQGGAPWTGNSSHFTQGAVSDRSVGLYRTVLDPVVIRYVEAVCYPELRRLGYPVSVAPEDIPDVIAGYDDPYRHERENLRTFFGDAARVHEEVRRFDFLRSGNSAPPEVFLFDDVAELLKDAMPA